MTYTPTAAPGIHHTTHENSGSDEITLTGLSGLLADSQNPLAHKTSHQSGGSDAIKLDDLAVPDDNTDLDVSIIRHGLTPKAPNDTTKFLRGDGTWATTTGDIVAGTATVTIIDNSTFNQILLASNANRLGAIIRNETNATLLIKFGGAAKTDDFTERIYGGKEYILPPNPLYTGEINGLWTQPTIGKARITELTP